MNVKGKKIHQGWYTLHNPQKFIAVVDEYMQSSADGRVQYKSGLELRMLRYCDLNTKIKRFSVEPFAIPYLKPTDGKVHRYYIDFFLEFCNGQKVMVEIKPKSQTLPPVQPRRKTPRSLRSYQDACAEYAINQAKWQAARAFAKQRGLGFIVLTEEQLC